MPDEPKTAAIDESFFKLLETLPDAMVVVRSDGDILHANSLVTEVFGYRPDEIVGQKIECLIPKGVHAAHQRHRDDYFSEPWRRPMGVGLELQGQRKDGTKFSAEISLSPVSSDVGPVVLAAVRDITLRVEARQDLAVARDELKKAEMELEVAREIQCGLLPNASPELPGFDVAGVSLPAVKAGGDYFGYQFLPNKHLALMVGDVTGHGVGAALLAAATHAYMRAFAQSDGSMGDLLPKLNRLLLEDTGGRRFITFFLGLLDWSDRTFRHASAGHNPTYILDASGQVKEELGSTGFPLGVFEECEFDDFSAVPLDTGDIIVVYTDGVVEAIGPGGEQFGSERALDVVRSHRDVHAQQLADLLISEAAEFCYGSMQDDATVVIAKVL